METPPRRLCRRALVYSILIAFALMASPSIAQYTPTVTFIPDTGHISAESSFAIIADPGAVPGTAKVKYIATGVFGDLQYSNGKFFCYFSETDTSGCGKSPFRVVTSERMDIQVFDGLNVIGNATVFLDIGSLKINSWINTYPDDNRASVLAGAYGVIAESMEYRVYDENFNAETSSYLPMILQEATGLYHVNITLEPGIHYIAFRADYSSDSGGGIAKVDMGGTSNGQNYFLQVDPFNLSVVYQAGAPIVRSKNIYNPLNTTFTGVTISLPQGLENFVSITLDPPVIGPLSTVEYTVTITGLSQRLDADTEAEIRSGGSVIGVIPLTLDISYASGTIECQGRDDGYRCNSGQGVCCNGACISSGDCCSDANCSGGEECSNHRCVSTDQACSSGTCYPGSLSCPTGYTETSSSCVEGGEAGICCIASGNECEGISDGASCNDYMGVCCGGNCIEDGDCCTNDECFGEGESCVNYLCTTGTGIPFLDDPQMLTMVIIAVVALVVVMLLLWVLGKKKGGGSEEELETFDEDEEFY